MPTTFVRKLSTSNQNMNGNRPRLYNYWTLDAGCMAPWEQKMRLAVAYALCRLCSKSPVPPGKDEERGRRAVLQARPLHSLSDRGDGLQLLLRRVHACHAWASSGGTAWGRRTAWLGRGKQREMMGKEATGNGVPGHHRLSIGI